MPIVVNLDVMLARRKMRLNVLAELVGITPHNLSVLKTGRAKAIRFSTLERICEVLECEVGDLLDYERPLKSVAQTLPEAARSHSPDESAEYDLVPVEA